MNRQPNVLVLMVDQMQGRVLDPGHPCATPNLDRLAARGMRFPRGYTPNPVCSPARASLMTGLLPHSHGVVQVNHCDHHYGSNLLLDKPHWAQRLQAAGYRTGYFGKWHVDRSCDLAQFGWTVDGNTAQPLYRERARAMIPAGQPRRALEYCVEGPEGYPPARLYSVIDRPAEQRGMGVACSLGAEFLAEVTGAADPWCCFVGITEPHDPYDTHEDAYRRYDPDAVVPPANWADDLAGRPGLYRQAARNFQGLEDRRKREAACCYWASISEIDAQFGRLLDQLEASGQAANTIVILTSDHGDHLGAHGLYQKNVGAFEEAYQVPLVVAGPGVQPGVVSDARVGLQDLCDTILELCGQEPFAHPDSRSFAPVLADPARSVDYQTGYAEYYGTRHWWTQRVVWNGPWKFVWNGFDVDELYHLEDDPGELHNLAEDPACRDQLRALYRQAYQVIGETDDHPLGNCTYASLRLGTFGPGIARDGA